MFLEILQNSPENTCARASFLIKLQAEACNFIKKYNGTFVTRYLFLQAGFVKCKQNHKGSGMLNNYHEVYHDDIVFKTRNMQKPHITHKDEKLVLEKDIEQNPY